MNNMNKSKLENGEVIEQEKRFLEWVKARDDDWWDEEYDGDKSSRLSIWDFRVMQEFFKEEITNALNQQREQIVGEIRELMIDDFDAREKELDAVPYKGETRAFVVAGEDLIYNYMKRVLTKLEK